MKNYKIAVFVGSLRKESFNLKTSQSTKSIGSRIVITGAC